MLKINKSSLLVALIFSAVVVSGQALNVNIPANLQDKVALSIRNARDGSIVYQYRGTTPMLLASNMKVVTSYVALNTLGESFTWSTKLAYSGSIQEHVLNGDLYLIGGGDPRLTTKDVKQLLKRLNQLHITQINGNLIVDSSIFNSSVTSSELQPEPLAEYSVDPAGLIIDSNLSTVKISIQKNKIKLQPTRIGNYKLINNLTLSKTKAECSSPSSYITATLVAPQKAQLSESIPLSCNQARYKLNLLPSFNYDQIVLRQLLNQQKIHLSGEIENAKAPVQYKLLATIKSPPLKQLLITMNKDSNNLYAKTMFLSVGAYKTTNSNTYNESKKLFQATLNSKLKSASNIELENGAGLSRNERMSPEQMTSLLYSLYLSPESRIFMQSLPSPSDSGTLQNEYPQFKQQLFAKTGSLNDVKAYSGYFISKNNHPYIISIIANGINASTSQQPQLIEFKQFFADTLSKLN